MKKTLLKKLALISVGMILTGSVGSITAPTVNAVSQKTYTKYSRKFNKVVALRPMQVYKVHPGNTLVITDILKPMFYTLVIPHGLDIVVLIGVGPLVGHTDTAF